MINELPSSSIRIRCRGEPLHTILPEAYNNAEPIPGEILKLDPVAQRDLFGEGTEAPVPQTGLFAEVVFDLPLDHAYTYHVPEKLLDQLAVGKRVLAPLGKGDRLTVGFCIATTDKAPERKAKELRRILDDEPLLPAGLMRLTRWMADYYLCGWGQVLNAVLPAGAKEQAGTRNAIFVEALAEAERPKPLPELTAKQAAAWELLQRLGQAVELRRLAQDARCGNGPVEALVAKGLARRFERRVERLIDGAEEPVEAHPPFTLNPDQEKVWTVLRPGLEKGGFQAFLLHGVTGSGKTEVYLRAIDEVMRQGKEALVLVPEISLTPQTIQRFQGRFGEVAVLHSHLGNAERGSQWRRVAGGQVQVVVGARSAVFAPTRRLGLIVIDEEHEGSFKQESTPRYHARDVAVMRARMEDIPILLGSATPSLESWHNAQRGQYTLLTLPRRVLDRPMPRVALIDLRHEKPRPGRPAAISPSLERAMREALRDGGQVMLLLNRRGFNTYIHCPECGHVQMCQFCDLALTYHRQAQVLVCHYCGYAEEPPKVCTQCSKDSVRFQGLGTEKLESEIEERFPGFVVRRMDTDTMRKPGSHAQVLSAFRHGLIHILMGTQMIAKGLDFPNVTLVGVVNADMGLNIPDFRAAERTFQLLSQVAGRAGRGPRGGKVLVQTFNPEHPAIALAAAHDYAGFVAAELGHRREHLYPPYQRLARLIIRSKKQEAAQHFAEVFAGAFQVAISRLPGPDEVRVLGPAEAAVFRLKGYHRYHFQLQSASAATLHQLLRSVLATAHPPAGVDFTVDIDPFSML